MLLVKYFAMCVENALVGSDAYTQVGTPRLSPPAGQRSRTAPATST